jgi:hypothetical protein
MDLVEGVEKEEQLQNIFLKVFTAKNVLENAGLVKEIADANKKCVIC